MSELKIGNHSINLKAFVGVRKSEFMKRYKGKGIFKVDLETVYQEITKAIKDQKLNKKGRK